MFILYLPYSPPLEQKTTLEPALTRKIKKKDSLQTAIHNE